MKHRLLSAFVIICICHPLWNLSAATPSPQRPNIIVILADDLGFSDLGCYGGEIETPHLDRLYQEGLRFSQFYNCALCGPSRAALMTGQYPHRVGIFEWTGLLNRRCVTLCEMMKQGGYQTAALGRLDMTMADVWHEPQQIARHVDRFLGSTGRLGPGHYFFPVRNNEFFRDGQPFLRKEPIYRTDLITDYAVEVLDQFSRGSQPFFLYMAQYAPHWPLHAKPADMAKYRERYRALGWDQARLNRHQRILESGLLPTPTKLAPLDSQASAWQTSPHHDWEAERMAAYAGQIDALDQSVGRVLDVLKRTGQADNTLIFFLSDNGASEVNVAPNLDAPGKTWRLDGTPTQVGNSVHHRPGSPDTFMSAGPAWSSLSNAPFRAHKNTNFEGGISTPCIVRWPAMIRQTGRTSHTPAHIVDIMATCLDVAGIEYPKTFQGRDVQPLSGISLAPLFSGKPISGHAQLCWGTSGCRAIREGDWKLVAGKQGPWELYNLATDRAEMDNLIDRFPDRVQHLSTLFREWEQNTDH